MMGLKYSSLSICQSKLVSNWQESSGLKGNIAKNIENIARMEILPDGKYFQKYCGRENCQETNILKGKYCSIEMKS